MGCVPYASKERPIFNTSGCGVRKSLLTKKAQLENDARSNSKIQVKRVQNSEVLYFKGRENG